MKQRSLTHLRIPTFLLVPSLILLSGVAVLGCSSSNSGKGAGADSGDGQDAKGAEVLSDAMADVEAGVDGIDGPEADGAETLAPESGEEVAAPDTEGDTIAPTDTMDATGETGTTDSSETTGPPASCCAVDDDCLIDSTVELVCRAIDQGQGFESWGVCVPAPDDGRCYADSDCAVGYTCDGASVCPCLMDCDMGYEGPGVCVPPTDVCVPIQGGWLQEICDAASVVYWDGELCRQGDFGECGCEPFCEYVFPDMASCLGACGGCVIFDGSCDDAIPDEPWWYFNGAACVEEDSCVCGGCPGTYATKAFCEQACHVTPPVVECPAYMAATRDCPYAWETFASSVGACPYALCMDAPCGADADCGAPGFPTYDGGHCVQGNCVTCWQDSQCDEPQVCRAGRCVWPDAEACGSFAGLVSCEEAGCSYVEASEVPCPICVCDSIAGKACAEDMDCQVVSSHPYRRCVYGRCAECGNDSECPSDMSCSPPGMCVGMDPRPRAMIGTWLIGWGGGMDHFSYFRFEPDGTLRRGSYVTEGAWSDDIPGLPCWPDGVMPVPLIGTWEPLMNESGSLILVMSLNVSCDPGDGWRGRYLITLSDDGMQAGFQSIDAPDGMQYTGFRKSPGNCAADGGICVSPMW